MFVHLNNYSYYLFLKIIRINVSQLLYFKNQKDVFIILIFLKMLKFKHLIIISYFNMSFLVLGKKSVKLDAYFHIHFYNLKIYNLLHKSLRIEI